MIHSIPTQLIAQKCTYSSVNQKKSENEPTLWPKTGGEKDVHSK